MTKTDGRQIVLNDGTIIPDGEAGYSDGFLWCYMNGYTMQQVATMFLDPSKTSKIIFQYGDMQDEWDGFTDCTNINVHADGKASVCLTRGND